MMTVRNGAPAAPVDDTPDRDDLVAALIDRFAEECDARVAAIRDDKKSRVPKQRRAAVSALLAAFPEAVWEETAAAFDAHLRSIGLAPLAAGERAAARAAAASMFRATP